MDISIEANFLIEKLREQMDSVPEGTALAFSGGVDSMLLKIIYGEKIKPYNLSFKNFPDREFCKKLSEKLNFSINFLDIEEIDVKESVDFLKNKFSGISNLDISFESLLVIFLKKIDEKYIMTGQGADELFYGYAKFFDGREIDNSNSVNKLINETLSREKKIAEHFGKKLICPYLSADIFKHFFTIGEEMKKTGNKTVIREALKKLGMPDFVYLRKKKAAQYGSGIWKNMR
ncbi:asparagine synthase-related protein [Caldiplasma sukawensis]